MTYRRSYTEKRAFPRLSINTDLTFILPGTSQVYSGFCNNLSHSGIHFSTRDAIPEGTSLDITIDPKNDKISPLRATIEVIRIDPSSDDTVGIAGKIVEYK